MKNIVKTQSLPVQAKYRKTQSPGTGQYFPVHWENRKKLKSSSIGEICRN